MQHTVLMRVLQGFGDLLHAPRRFVSIHRMLAHQLLQALPRDVFHAEPRHSVIITHLIDANDARMLQPCRSLRFAMKPLTLFPTRELRPQQHLHCHDAIQRLLSRPINHPHATTPEFFIQLTAGDACPWCSRFILMRCIRFAESDLEKTARAMSSCGQRALQRPATGGAEFDGRFSHQGVNPYSGLSITQKDL